MAALYGIGQTIIFSSCGFFFFFIAALCNRAGHYIFAPWFLLLSSIYLSFSSPNLSGRRVDVYHSSILWHMV